MDVLSLSDGSVEIISNVKDFSDLLERKLGSDVRNWFDDFVADNVDDLIEE